jgi:hypothetical protein
VHHVLTTAWTVFAQLQPVRIVNPVLGGGIVARATLGASQRNDYPVFFVLACHRCSLLLLDNLGDHACAYRVTTFAHRKPQALLHRYRRD